MEAAKSPPVEELHYCRICHATDEQSDDLLIHPCRCKGSLRFIHESCLKECINARQDPTCDICKYKFKFKKIYMKETPERLPVIYMLYRLLSNLWNGSLRLCYLSYLLFRFFLVFLINGLAYSRLIEDVTSHKLLFTISAAICGTLANFCHSYIFSVVKAVVLSKRRARLDPRMALNAMRNEMADQPNGQASQNSDEETERTSEQTESAESTEMHISDDVLELRTINGIRSDLTQVFSFTWPSIILLLVYVGRTQAFELASLSLSYSSMCAFPIYGFTFSDLSKYNTLLLFLMSEFYSVIFFVFILFIAEHLRTRLSNPFLRVCFSFAKIYVLLTILTFYSYLVIGFAFHIGLYYFINHKTEIFSTINHPLFYLVHSSIGLIIIRAINIWRDYVYSQVRPGLVRWHCDLKRLSMSIKRLINTPVTTFLVAIPYKLLIYSFYIISTFYIQNQVAKFVGTHLPVFQITSFHSVFVYLKIVSLIFLQGESISNLLGSLHLWILRKLAPLFSMQNFIFNERIPVGDKSRLVWDCNRSPCSKLDLERVARINNLRQLHTNSNQLRMKYEINERRIQKYYGVRHKRRFSIFYKPKLYWLFYLLFSLACYSAVQVLLVCLLSCASLISQRMPFSSDVSFILSVMLLLRIILFAGKSCHQIIKSVIVLFYRNILWPTTIAMSYLFLSDKSDGFFRFSSIFVIFFAFSAHLFYFCSFILFAFSYERMSYRRIIKQLVSFYFWKLFMIGLLIMARGLFTFRYLIWACCTLIIGWLILNVAKLLISREWIESVRDEYFMVRSVAENYDHENKE